MKVNLILIAALAAFTIHAQVTSPPARFLVYKGGKFGFIDQTGALVIPLAYRGADRFSEGLAPVMTSTGRFAIIDTSGRIVASPVLTNAFPTSTDQFSEGLIGVFDPSRNLCGYVNSSGRISIPLKFTAAESFSEGLAPVRDASGKWGWIDKTGTFVIQPQFDGGGQFKEGIARFARGKKSGYLIRSGKIIVEAQYILVSDYSEGIGRTWDGDGSRTRFLDKSGRLVFEIEPEDSAAPFHEGLSAAKIGGQRGFLDKSGKMILKIPFNTTGSFSEGLAPVGIEDKVDTSKMSDVEKFEARYGSKSLQSKTKWGCIDRTGKVVIAPQFPSGPVFKNGLAKIKTPEGNGYIDRTGKWVWQPSK